MYFKKIFFSLAVFYCSLPMVSHADQVNPYQAHHLEDTEKILIQFFSVRDSNLVENPIEIQTKDIPLILDELNRNIEYSPGVTCDCLGDGKMFFILQEGSEVECRLKHENIVEFNFGKRNNEFLEMSDKFEQIISHYYPKQDGLAMPACPICGKKDNIIPIVYGFPGLCLLNDDRAGKVLLGGCLKTDHDLQYYCKTCEKRF